MRRIISLLLVSIIFLGLAAPVSATDNNGAQPRFTYINSLTNSFSINSSTKVASCTGTISVPLPMSVKVVATLQIQENGVWRNVNSRTATGTVQAVASYNPTVNSGYQYKLVVTGYVYDSNGNLLEKASSEKTAWCI